MSLPPPVLPPQVVARTRIRALSTELGQEQNLKLRAALAYEIGALSELRLSDNSQALDHYRYAAETDPSFRPALFALRRLLGESRDHEELVRVLAKIVNASDLPAERAAALIDLGCLLDDQLADRAGAKSAFERALAADPGSLSAMLMLERSLLAQNHRAEAEELTAKRTSYTSDPRLRSALSCEVAREQASHGSHGSIDAAVETLLSAMALPGRHLATLRTLAELATRYDRPIIAARACEDLGALAAAFAAGQTGPEPRELAARYPDVQSAAAAAAFFYRAAGRLHGRVEGHAPDAVLAYERALACQHDDVLLGLERVSAYEAADDLSSARAGLLELLPQAEPRRAAALQFQLAELAERQSNPGEALERLRAALALAPDAAVVAAVLEDRLLDAGDYTALCDLLVERAQRSQGEERSCALLRAALLADRAHDGPRAYALFAELAALVSDATPLLREWYGTALRFGPPTALREAAARLLACDIDHAERSAVMRSCYEAALGDQDINGARTLLRAALDEPACEGWASHSAWVLAALHADRELLSQAHQKLAELAERVDDNELAAAHLAAQSRALVRLNDHGHAVTQLRRALALLPTHTYAVALLEESLLAHGETAEAVHLLRESASAEQDAQRSEAALLHAGAAAEAAGRLDLARSSYDEAAERDPLAFSALWSRLRFAERTGDNELRLSALRALAARETTLDRPGSAQLELGEALIACDELESAVLPLTAALSNESSAFEAAASAALLPRAAQADALRPRALSYLAEHSERPARDSLEHERSAELVHVQPSDARTLLAAHPGQAAEPSSALLSWLLCSDQAERAPAIEALSVLASDPAERAEFVLHALRVRAGLGDTNHANDADALVIALGLAEEAPGLASALALDEALSAADDADTRVLGLTGLLEHMPPSAADSVRSALARAELDAGHSDRAIELTLRLVGSAPDDLSSWETLRVAAREAADFERVVLACDQLARHCTGTTHALLLEEAAAVLHEQLAHLPEAETRLRAVLEAIPDRGPAFERLHDVLVELQDLDGLIALLAQRVAVTSSEPERIDLMYERARILRGRGERDAALSCAEELLSLAPAHPGALGLSAEIHASRENFPEAVDALRALALAEIPPNQQRLAREGAADFLDDKLHNPHAAYLELRPLVPAQLADLTVHVRMADLAQRAGLMSQAADALMHAAEVSRGLQRAAFERRAATLQLEALAQPDQATESYRRALLAHPTDGDAFEALFAIASSEEERDLLSSGFLDAIWAALVREPSEALHLRALLRTGRVTQQPVLELISLSALDALGLANSEEQSAWQTLRSRQPKAPLGKLDTVALKQLTPDRLSEPLARFARAACAAYLHVRADTPEQHGVDKRARVGKRDTLPVRETLRTWLSAFELELDELYVSASQPRLVYAVHASGTKHSWIVGRDIESPWKADTRHAWAQLAAAARGGFLPLLDGEPNAARERLRAALAAVGGTSLDNAETRVLELKVLIERKLPRALRRELEESVKALNTVTPGLETVDIGAVPATITSAVRTLSARLGLCAAADLDVALSALLGSSRELSTLLESKPALDLLSFWLSPRCAALLQKLGLCL